MCIFDSISTAVKRVNVGYNFVETKINGDKSTKRNKEKTMIKEPAKTKGKKAKYLSIF